MGEIYDAVIAFFTEDEWPFTEVKGKPIIRTAFSGENGSWACYAQAREEQYRLVFYSILEAKVAEEKRLAMAEFITRANYGLALGNLEMDYSDGEIRFKTSIDVEGDRLTPALIKQLVYANVLTMDRYFPGIMEVMYTNTPPAEAIAKIEG